MKIDYYIVMGIMYTGVFIFVLALFDGGKGIGMVAIGAAACAIGLRKVMIHHRL